MNQSEAGAPLRDPAWYRLALGSWRAGDGLLPTTSRGAEIAVVITIVGWRVGTLISLMLAVPASLDRSTAPWLDAVLLTAVFAWSAVSLTWVIGARSCANPRWATIEAVIAVICLALEPFYVPIGSRVGTWVGWAPGIAINFALSAAVGFPRRRDTLLIAVALGGTYVAVGLPEVGHGTDVGTLASNTSSYLVFAVLGRVMAGFVRRFGRDADAARESAVEATRRLETERSRRLLHDPASLLRYLADPGLDPALADTVRAQALAEANRIRAYLTDDGPMDVVDSSNGLVRLTQVVRSATTGFTDLPIELMLDLADGVQLDRAAADAVGAATATVLHNVRRHAGTCSQVVVHADFQTADSEWELTIRDDGIGFDPDSTARGYGLSQLADAALAEHDISSNVHSQPGLGTTITIREAYNHDDT